MSILFETESNSRKNRKFRKQTELWTEISGGGASSGPPDLFIGPRGLPLWRPVARFVVRDSGYFLFSIDFVVGNSILVFVLLPHTYFMLPCMQSTVET